MKINSLTKFFTFVLFLVVSGLASLGFGVEGGLKIGKSESEIAAEYCSIESNLPILEPGSKFKKPYDKCVYCYGNQEKKGCDLYEDPESKGSCKSDFEAWEKTIDETNAVCQAIIAKPEAGKSKSYRIDTKKTCSDQVARCKQLMSSTNPLARAGESRTSETVSALEAIINSQQRLIDSTSTNPRSPDKDNLVNCIDTVNTDKAIDNRKKLRDELDKIQKEKNELEDEITKQQKEVDEKEVEIAKDKSELERDLKEKKRGIDTKKREQLIASQKAKLESAKRIRDKNKVITDKNNALKRLQFNFQRAQVSQSTEKINRACRTALEKAKSCMLRSSRNQLAAGDAECAQFPTATLTNKRGIKATSEATRKLKVIESECYEQANEQRKSDGFQLQEQINAINLEIAELQADLEQESSTQNIDQANEESINAEADREAAELEANMQQQFKEYDDELAKLNNLTQVKRQRIAERLQETQERIDALMLEERTGARSSINTANIQIQKNIRLANKVRASCKCSENKKSQFCTNLENDDPETKSQRNKAKR